LYAFNTDRFSTEEAYLERYPGDEWVDITGFDIYQANNIANSSDFQQEFDKTLTLLEGIAGAHDKIPALTEFGYNGLADSSWWTRTFLPTLSRHKIAYVMAWRNAGYKKDGSHEFYVPYKGQASADDFVKFYKDNHTLFQQDVWNEKLYF
ncbi:MAG: glycosyl hydrolase, partial [Bacteroidota bacterium]